MKYFEKFDLNPRGETTTDINTQPRDAKGKFKKIAVKAPAVQSRESLHNTIMKQHREIITLHETIAAYNRNETKYMNVLNDYRKRERKVILISATIGFIAGTIFFLILNAIVKK
jgi:hypothetical protein